MGTQATQARRPGVLRPRRAPLRLVRKHLRGCVTRVSERARRTCSRAHEASDYGVCSNMRYARAAEAAPNLCRSHRLSLSIVEKNSNPNPELQRGNTCSAIAALALHHGSSNHGLSKNSCLVHLMFYIILSSFVPVCFKISST